MKPVQMTSLGWPCLSNHASSFLFETASCEVEGQGVHDKPVGGSTGCKRGRGLEHGGKERQVSEAWSEREADEWRRDTERLAGGAVLSSNPNPDAWTTGRRSCHSPGPCAALRQELVPPLPSGMPTQPTIRGARQTCARRTCGACTRCIAHAHVHNPHMQVPQMCPPYAWSMHAPHAPGMYMHLLRMRYMAMPHMHMQRMPMLGMHMPHMHMPCMPRMHMPRMHMP
eukprot:176344-Chlamydomonas_euryale.AAC.1